MTCSLLWCGSAPFPNVYTNLVLFYHNYSFCCLQCIMLMYLLFVLSVLLHLTACLFTAPYKLDSLETAYENKRKDIHKQRFPPPCPEILIEVVNEVECMAVICEMEGRIAKYIYEGHPYYYGCWGNVPVVMIQLYSKHGSHLETGSLTRTKKALELLPEVKHVFGVGICCAAERDGDDGWEAKLGCVVISTHIIGYDHQEITETNLSNHSYLKDCTNNKFYHFLQRFDNKRKNTKFGKVLSGSKIIANDSAQQQILEMDHSKME